MFGVNFQWLRRESWLQTFSKHYFLHFRVRKTDISTENAESSFVRSLYLFYTRSKREKVT